MEFKEAFLEKLEGQLKEWSGKIEALKTRAETAATGAKTKYREEIESLRAKSRSAQEKLQELKGVGGGAWEDLRVGMERAWDELRQGVEGAFSRFQENGDHEEEIRSIAYQIWEEEGHPDGRDLEHWLRAESIWRERRSRDISESQPEPPAQPAKGQKKRRTTKTR